MSLVTTNKRIAIFIRDRGICQYCGVELDAEKNSWEIDHKIPSSKGGESLIDNLLLACGKCNRNKSNKSPSEYRDHLVEKFTKASANYYQQVMDYFGPMEPCPFKDKMLEKFKNYIEYLAESEEKDYLRLCISFTFEKNRPITEAEQEHLDTLEWIKKEGEKHVHPLSCSG